MKNSATHRTLLTHPFLPKNLYTQENLNLDQRRHYVRRYGFALVTQETLRALIALVKGRGTVLDAGCGSGFIAKALHDAGLPVLAVGQVDYSNPDSFAKGYPMRERYVPVQVGHAQDYVSQAGVVLLAWPCYEKPFGFEVARALKPGQMLIYQGEGPGGCTGDDALHELLEDENHYSCLKSCCDELNRHHRRFEAIHDSWHVYMKHSQAQGV